MWAKVGVLKLVAVNASPIGMTGQVANQVSLAGPSPGALQHTLGHETMHFDGLYSEQLGDWETSQTGVMGGMDWATLSPTRLEPVPTQVEVRESEALVLGDSAALFVTHQHLCCGIDWGAKRSNPPGPASNGSHARCLIGA